MEVTKHSEGQTRIYELTLDKKDIRILDSGFSEGIVSPVFPTGERFQIFPHPYYFSESFHVLPTDHSTYYIYMGDINVKKVGDLEKLIAEKGRIPIEIPGTIKPINVGYVVLKVA